MPSNALKEANTGSGTDFKESFKLFLNNLVMNNK